MKPLSGAAIERLRETIDRPHAGDRYDVHEMLGRGGMGSVYRAHDSILGRDVALKVLSTDADAAALASRLAREARVLARLEHPGIVAVHDAGVLEDGRPFYVMRLAHGKQLDAYAMSAGRGDLLRVFLGICDAVAYAHARDVIHRDLSPANIMVGEFGEVLVLDWGVAKVAGESAPSLSQSSAVGSVTTADGVVIGTPGFMAPEQASGGAATADTRADTYGLGAILRHLCNAHGADIPRPLASIIERATALNPAERFESVSALADDVRHFLDGERVLAHREGILERGARLYKRNQALILLLLAYAIMRVTILLWRGI
ncbi:MAG: serine/threonine-protein kinase [Gemmatimonadales bacterium]